MNRTKRYVTYDSTGRIHNYGFTQMPLEIQEYPEDGGIMEGEGHWNTHYVTSGQITLRPEMPVAQDGNTLTVPPNTEFKVRGPAHLTGVTEDGVLEFEFSEPGTYIVKLTNFPYLDAEVTLESHS